MPNSVVPINLKNQFDIEKATEIILYVGSKCQDLYTALKVIYFADKKHLGKYGRLISRDRYVALQLGPVPSGIYDIVKSVWGKGLCKFDPSVYAAFQMAGNKIQPSRPPNLDCFSESDIECLDESIKKYGNKSFEELKRISHEEPAFKAADINGAITLESIAESLPNSKALLDYLADR